MPIPETPHTREEAYLNAIATGDSGGIPETPYTREEMYLDYIARNGGGGGGGSSTLSGLTDVDISNPSDGQTLVYNATAGKWENGAGGGSGVLRVVSNYDDQTDASTLSETWKTIYDAISNGAFAFVFSTFPSYDAGEPDSVFVNSIIGVEVNNGAHMVVINNDVSYGTWTQDGYPVYPIPEPPAS